MHEDILLERAFVRQLPALIRALCAMVQLPEGGVLSGVESLKTLSDLRHLCDEIFSEGEVSGLTRKLFPVVRQDENSQEMVSGLRVAITNADGRVYFTLALLGGVLTLKGADFNLNPHQAADNFVWEKALRDVPALPTHIKRALGACAQAPVFRLAKASGAVAAFLLTLVKAPRRYLLHCDVAHHIRDALDVIEAVREVPESNTEHLGEAWALHSMYASPEQQAAFLAEDMPGCAPEVSVEMLAGPDNPEVVRGVSLILPLGEEEMIEVFVEEEGVSVDVAGVVFELPCNAEGRVRDLAFLSPENMAIAERAFKALRPFARGQAEKKRREALLFMKAFSGQLQHLGNTCKPT